MACIHGFAPSECLICRTLSSDAYAPTSARTVAPGRTERRRGRIRGGPVEVVRPGRAGGGAGGAGGGHWLGPLSHVLVGVAAVVALLAVLFFVAGIVFAVLRLVELVAVAVVVALVAYRLGRARGHRDR
jgi:hypothetical protein